MKYSLITTCAVLAAIAGVMTAFAEEPRVETAVTVDVRVWRSVADPTMLYLSTRPQGGSWTTHAAPLDLSQRHPSGHWDLSNHVTAVIPITVIAGTPDPPRALDSAGATIASLPPAVADAVLAWPNRTPWAVQEGDSLLGLAIDFNTPVEAIAVLNGITHTDQIVVGDLLLIPVGFSLPPGLWPVAEGEPPPPAALPQTGSGGLADEEKPPGAVSKEWP